MNIIKKMSKTERNEFFWGWPNYIIYDGRKVYRSDTEDNHALYMLPGAYMNKKIWISKDEFIRHNKKFCDSV
jgi:hypothetical protein